MIQNKKLINDFTLLVRNEQWVAAKSWFLYSKEETTHKIEHDIEGEKILIDTGVKEEFIDKVLIWGHFFMSDYLRDPSPEFHRDLIAFFFSPRNEYVAAPRGFSKTTIIQLCISFSVCHQLDTFIALIEKSFTEASEVLYAVRDVLKNEPMIKKIYGKMYAEELKTSSKDPDAKGDLLINGVRLRGKGFNATIRGLKSKAHRPSRVVMDDVESDEHINNPEQRKKYLENYNKGIQPAVDIDGSIKVFGTILHFDSLLMNLIKWHKGKIYRAYDPKEPSKTLLWPARWTLAALSKKKDDMQSAGQGSDAFAQEYLNDPISDDERTFKQMWLWQANRMLHLRDLRNKVFNGYAAIDVADSISNRADFTGVVVHLVDSKGNRFRVSCRREKRNVLGKIDLIFEIWEKWKPWGLLEIGIEKKAFNDEILPMLEKESEKRQIYPVVSELRPMRTSKKSRIKANLQGLYEQGKIYTIIDEDGKSIEDTEALLNELYNYPASKNDDLSDAEAYITDMVQIPLDEGGKIAPVKAESTQDDPFAGVFEEKDKVCVVDDDPYS